MTIFHEFDRVRLKVPVQGCCVYCCGEVYSFAAGTQCIIVDILSGGNAFEVEFEVGKSLFDTDEGPLYLKESCILTLTPDQLEPLP